MFRYLKKQKLKDKEKELDEKRRFWLEELKQYLDRRDGREEGRGEGLIGEGRESV